MTYFSGRCPALGGATLFHAVNNVLAYHSGHMFKGASEDMGLYEGIYLYDIPDTRRLGLRPLSVHLRV